MKTLRYFFVAALAMVFGGVMAEETIDFTAQSYTNGQAVPNFTGTNVTITWEQNGGSNAPKYYNAGTAVRMYAKNKATFTASKAIKAIKFVLDADGLINDNNKGFDSGEYDASTTKWTGNTSTLVLTNAATSGNQIRIQKLTFYFEGDEIPADVHIANTEETAYTVAKAYELIDAGEALSETVFVKGIISQIDSYNSTYGSITYWISDDGTTTKQLQCYSGLNISAEKFTSKEDIAVGANVIVKGTIKKYGEIYEFNQNNELVKYVAGGDTPVPSGDIEFGIARPRAGTESSWSYKNFVSITTADFVKDKSGIGKGMNVKFYESEALNAKLAKDQSSESGYEIATNIRYHGSQVNVDYVWKIQCSDPDTQVHLHNGVKSGESYAGATPNEDYTFGFDFTIPEGKTFAVDSVYFNLLVEQNASTNVRILKGSNEVFNSGWSYAANGYNQHKIQEGQWVYGWCASINKTGWNAFYGEDHKTLYAIKTVKDFMVSKGGGYKPLGDLKLGAGDYRLVVSVDWNNENAKALSFDEFTIAGKLDGATGIEAVKAAKAVKADNVMYNLAGQKVDAAYKGMVIMNGKKFMNK